MTSRTRRTHLSALAGLALSMLTVAAAPALGADASEARHFADERGISVADAAQRLDWQRAAGQLVDEAEAGLGERFGGVWVDPGDGDRVKLGVTAADGATRANAKRALARVGLDGSADVVEVEHSQRELEAAGGWIAARLEQANGGAPEVLGTGIRTDVNSVEISLPHNGDLSRAQRALVDDARARFGAAVRTRESHSGRPARRACVHPYCDPPLRAGIRINGDGSFCTGAFIARGRDAGYLYQMTAGHCRYDPNATWSSKFPNGTSHAIGTFRNIRVDSTTDAGILNINNVAGWAPRDFILITNSPDTSFTDTYKVLNDGNSVVNMRVCTTGAAWGQSDCGYVSQTNATITDEYGTTSGLVRANFCGIDGDSGAPMYSYNVAYGLQIDGYSMCDSLYTPIRVAENAMNVDVVFE